MQKRYGFYATACAALLMLALVGVGMARVPAVPDARGVPEQGCALYAYLESVCVPTATPTRSPTNTPYPLSNTEGLIIGLNDPPCIPACWIGIQPGVTTMEEALLYATERGFTLELEPQSFAPPVLAGQIYGVYSTLFLEIMNEYETPEPSTAISAVWLHGSFDIEAVQASMGAPRVNYGDPRVGFDSIYSQLGIYFSYYRDADQFNYTMAWLLGIIEDDLRFFFSIEDGDSDIITNCSKFGYIPCRLPTATATPPG